MIIKLREKELSITKEEAQKINEALLAYLTAKNQNLKLIG